MLKLDLISVDSKEQLPVETESRQKLAKAEAVIRQMPQLEIPLQHFFADGVYARQGFIPKHTVFVGRVHLHSQINIISQGNITVLTEQGVVHLVAPCTWVSPAGAQRAAIAHEDTVWTTILGTTETDPDVIYDTYTAPTYEQFQLVQEELLQIIKE